MAKWSYKATRHNLAEMHKKPERIIECDTGGLCMVHGMSEQGLDVIKEVLDAEGAQGWELVQCNYHEGELLCVWKREMLEA